MGRRIRDRHASAALRQGGLAITLDGFKAYYSDEGASAAIRAYGVDETAPRFAGDPGLGVWVVRLRDELVY